MSALQETDLHTDIKELVGAVFWKWFHDHQDRKITTVKIWFIKKSVYVRDLRSIFELLFGDDPTSAA